MPTSFLDYERLEQIDTEAFRSRKPYPFVNPTQLLTEEGYQRLRAVLPPPERLDRFFDVERSHGQMPHDRLVLEYHRDLDVAEEWHAFVRELQGRQYRRFLYRMFDTRFLMPDFHWHYTPRGCSVSPHCDAKHKLGSHIFYFNTEDDWEPSWGGQTLVLDDGGRFSRNSAPAFEEFDSEFASTVMGNSSFLFCRGNSSWHGVREIRCPEGAFRKVFIVVVNDFKRGIRRVLKARMKGQRVSGY